MVQHNNVREHTTSDATLNCDGDAGRFNTAGKPHTATCRTRIEGAMASDEVGGARLAETLLLQMEAYGPTADFRVRRGIEKGASVSGISGAAPNDPSLQE